MDDARELIERAKDLGLTDGEIEAAHSSPGSIRKPAKS